MVATRRLGALSASVAQRLDLPNGNWPNGNWPKGDWPKGDWPKGNWPKSNWPKSNWIVALSGGADSAALAWLTSRVGPIRAVHIHHGLAASDALEQAARAVAKALAIPVDVLSVTLERFTENEARKARYRALASVLGEGEWILTAHTADDQAETVLANLLRGAGVDGLAGIPARRGQICRPMLDVTRSETRELATLAGLPWMDDPGNADLGPLRNRIRLQLIPQLEAEFNPAIRRHLAVAARAISAAPVAGPDPGEAIGGGWRVAAGVLWAMGSEEAVRSMRPVVRRLREGYGLDRSESERVWAVACGAAKAAELSGGLRVERSGPWFVISAVDRPAGQAVDEPADGSADDRGVDQSG